jgi:hypothetical protein
VPAVGLGDGREDFGVDAGVVVRREVTAVGIMEDHVSQYSNPSSGDTVVIQ